MIRATLVVSTFKAYRYRYSPWQQWMMHLPFYGISPHVTFSSLGSSWINSELGLVKDDVENLRLAGFDNWYGQDTLYMEINDRGRSQNRLELILSDSDAPTWETLLGRIQLMDPDSRLLSQWIERCVWAFDCEYPIKSRHHEYTGFNFGLFRNAREILRVFQL